MKTQKNDSMADFIQQYQQIQDEKRAERERMFDQPVLFPHNDVHDSYSSLKFSFSGSNVDKLSNGRNDAYIMEEVKRKYNIPDKKTGRLVFSCIYSCFHVFLFVSQRSDSSQKHR